MKRASIALGVVLIATGLLISATSDAQLRTGSSMRAKPSGVQRPPSLKKRMTGEIRRRCPDGQMWFLSRCMCSYTVYEPQGGNLVKEVQLPDIFAAPTAGCACMGDTERENLTGKKVSERSSRTYAGMSECRCPKDSPMIDARLGKCNLCKSDDPLYKRNARTGECYCARDEGGTYVDPLGIPDPSTRTCGCGDNAVDSGTSEGCVCLSGFTPANPERMRNGGHCKDVGFGVTVHQECPNRWMARVGRKCLYPETAGAELGCPLRVVPDSDDRCPEFSSCGKMVQDKGKTSCLYEQMTNSMDWEAKGIFGKTSGSIGKLCLPVIEEVSADGEPLISPRWLYEYREALHVGCLALFGFGTERYGACMSNNDFLWTHVEGDDAYLPVNISGAWFYEGMTAFGPDDIPSQGRIFYCDNSNAFTDSCYCRANHDGEDARLNYSFVGSAVDIQGLVCEQLRVQFSDLMEDSTICP